VAYTKDTGDVHYTSTSPNDHLIYGTLTDPTQAPVFKFNDSTSQTVTAHVDTLTNTFYIDESDMSNVTTPITSLRTMVRQNTNITSIKKFNIDTSNVTNTREMFGHCTNLEYVNLSNLTTTSIQEISSMFNFCSNLKVVDLSGWDLTNTTSHGMTFSWINGLQSVYITEESTLMMLTGDLQSAENEFVPPSATIYYNDQVYKWQNNAWTLQ